MRRNKVRVVVVASVLLVACSSSNKIVKYSEPNKASNVTETKAEKQQEAARVRVQLGQRYMEQGKLEIAMENLQKALEYDPNYVDAHTVIGVLYERIGNAKAAEEHYAKAAQLAPKSGDANNNYGQFLCATGRYAQAQTYFANAMADPFYKTPDVLYTNAGSCLMKEGGTHLDDAAADFRKALEANPKNPVALFEMANVLYQKNDFFRARAFIQRFEALGKPDPGALLLARNIEVKLGHADSAHDYAQRLRESFPDSDQIRALDSTTSSTTEAH
ncbi:MAG: type IV pilus biogenesis/stability protein PilW [Rudaea sp.]